MLRKKETYTNVTPIPSNIPRQLAVEILHSHGEIITLNPLVTGYEPIKAPRDASAEEFYSTWYEIEERIQFVPGMGKLGSGKIKFRGCFHDMPWGLQTHIYAPANVDLRNTWRIAGNQPGEPREIAELGINAPAEGLYLREDVEIKCNVTMVNFVKKETKAASKALVDRLIRKAELLDSGVLLAMMENGRLKTINPADRTHTMSSSNYANSPTSPTQYAHSQYAPSIGSPTFAPKMNLPFQPGAHHPYAPQGPHAPQDHYAPQDHHTPQGPHASYAPQYSPHTYQRQSKSPAAPAEIRFELPGNHSYLSADPRQAQHNGGQQFVSELPAASPSTSASARWSNSQSDRSYSNSRPNSTPLTTTSSVRSSKNDQTRPYSDLPAVREAQNFR